LIVRIGVVIAAVISRNLLSRLAVALLGLPLLVAGTDARAQARLDANYEVSLAGLTIGKGSWVIELGDDQYSAVAVGGSSGLLRAVSTGQGSGGSQGRIVKGQLQPASYTVTISTSNKTETIRMALAAGNIKDFSIDPQPPEDPFRIPVTDAHKRGVSDPMTASLVHVPGTADPVSADACTVTSAVFDGRMRYDLSLEFKRIETVKVDGYQGPVVVCAIYFAPVAGYNPERSAIKYLAAQRHMELWLAPIAGTRVLVPYRLTIPTPLGTGKLEATRLISTPVVAHGTTAAAPKTQ
jgi:Protein of unknown function (DUF3108)